MRDLQEWGQIQGFPPFRLSIADLGKREYYFMTAQNHRQVRGSTIALAISQELTVFPCILGGLPSIEPKEEENSRSWAGMR